MKNQFITSYILLTYNHERYIVDAIMSAFQQTYQPLEIIISDDASKDNTFEIVKEMCQNYNGPHRIIVNRNIKREGICSHLNKCISLSSGELIVCAAGDDISLPERTEEMVRCFENKNIYGAFSNSIIIDENGRSGVPFFEYIRDINDNIKQIETYNKRVKIDIQMDSSNKNILYASGVHGASHVFRKCIYDILGPIKHTRYFEDCALASKENLLGKIVYNPKMLVKHRRHTGNLISDQKTRHKRYRQIIFIEEVNMQLDLKEDIEVAFKKGLIKKEKKKEMYYSIENHIARSTCRFLNEKDSKHRMYAYALISFIFNQNRFEFLKWFISCFHQKQISCIKSLLMKKKHD